MTVFWSTLRRGGFATYTSRTSFIVRRAPFIADMDVAVMNKSTLRLTAIGGILLLCSFAFALAQHDSRKRTRSNEEFKAVPNQPAIPISLDGAEAAEARMLASELPSVVRANNDELQSHEGAPVPTEQSLAETVVFDNPLRSRAEAELVVTASANETAEGPSDLMPALPTSLPPAGDALPSLDSTAPVPALLSANPPSWLNGSQGATQPMPAAPTALPSESPAALPQFPAAQLPPAPIPNASAGESRPMPSTGPTQGGGSAATPPSWNTGATTTTNSDIPTFPIAVGASTPTRPNSSGNNNFSDTQRPSMPVTNMPGAGAQTAPTQDYPSSQTNTTQYGTASPNNPAQTRPSPYSGANSSTNTTNNVGRINRQEQVQNYGDSSPANHRNLMQASSTNPRAAVSLAGLVSNEPGNRYLDGSQNPILQIQKRGQEEVRVGKPTTFTITVRNAGNFTAHDVTVVDSVPRGMRFSDANPPVSPTTEGLLTWKLGEMQAGDERTINLQLIPEREGELGSVASVHFAAQASMRTVATQPKLELNVNPQTECVIGGEQSITVTIKNIGTGVARDVEVQADLPSQLSHSSGVDSLRCPCPDLAPSQSVTIPLVCSATNPGQSICLIRALTENEKHAEQQVPVNVLAPSLSATVEGPRKRYLDRQATYTFKVTNTGTATATQVVFDVHLPSGLRFNAHDNNQAMYDPMDHTVKIGLRELKVGETAPLKVTVLPVERGPQVISMNVKADLGVTAEATGQVDVEGLSEMEFTIGQEQGTIEIGTSTVYTVQITNMGNIPDRNVRLAVLLPDGAQLVRVIDAPVQAQSSGNQVLFQPIDEMRTKDQRNFRFEVRHNQVGSKIIRTELTSENWPSVMIKELGTRVYDDRN
jgi:uncharacterized repeat protein (TIGR01451 family)